MLGKSHTQSSSISILVINSLFSSFCIQTCILWTDKDLTSFLKNHSIFDNFWTMIMFLKHVPVQSMLLAFQYFSSISCSCKDVEIRLKLSKVNSFCSKNPSQFSSLPTRGFTVQSVVAPNQYMGGGLSFTLVFHNLKIL